MRKSLREIEFTDVELVEKSKVAKDTMTFKFKVPENQVWSEGTHMQLAFEDYTTGIFENKNKVHTISIMSLNEEGYLGITTRIRQGGSYFKRRLSKLKAGDKMLIFKVGSRMGLRRENRPIVLISMGVGLATFRPLIKAFEKDSTGITTLVNINIDSNKSFIYHDEITSIKNKNFENHFVSSRNEFNKAISTTVSTHKDGLYYVVGSDEFVKHLCDYLIVKSIAKGSIVIDKNSRKKKNFL